MTFSFFFFQAEDGIRDKLVTGVQTCALPISSFAIPGRDSVSPPELAGDAPVVNILHPVEVNLPAVVGEDSNAAFFDRSEEHTSELQSLAYLVCRLLLEKKKTKPRFKRVPSQ